MIYLDVWEKADGQGRNMPSQDRVVVRSNTTLSKPLVVAGGVKVRVEAGAVLTLAAQPRLPLKGVSVVVSRHLGTATPPVHGSAAPTRPAVTCLPISRLNPPPAPACPQVFSGEGLVRLAPPAAQAGSPAAAPPEYDIAPEWFDEQPNDSFRLDAVNAACEGVRCRVLLTAPFYLITRAWRIGPHIQPWVGPIAAFAAHPNGTGQGVVLSAGAYNPARRLDLPRLFDFHAWSVKVEGGLSLESELQCRGYLQCSQQTRPMPLPSPSLPLADVTGLNLYLHNVQRTELGVLLAPKKAIADTFIELYSLVRSRNAFTVQAAPGAALRNVYAR